jgi:transglutaminase-like putative cysteine protease
MESDEARKYVEYSVTMLAPSTSVIYAPDSPITVSVPTVYEFRADRRDFALLRPLTAVQEQQRYSVLAAVTTASMVELRQAGSVYPEWTRKYRELPVELPDTVRRESWRVVGEATNAYDAAVNIEQHLRGMTYSTRVPVPPGNQDWVGFLLFNSKEGYCDYFSTAMTVMLRSVGIPARVASGYVTGDWDAMTQSYLVTERHAHTWTEVYFPSYGWIPFEPSASRPLPPRVEAALAPLSEIDLGRLAEVDRTDDEFFDDEEFYDSGGALVLPPTQTGPAISPGMAALTTLSVMFLVGLIAVIILWLRGMAGLPAFARPYAQTLRLASWCGFGPARAHTPYEYAEALGRAVPSAAQPISTITEAYVAGRYGGRPTESASHLAAAALQARTILLRSLALDRARAWLRARVRELVSNRKPTP